MFTQVPGIKVVMPSGPADAYSLLLASINDPDPVIFFEPKMLYRSASGLMVEPEAGQKQEEFEAACDPCLIKRLTGEILS
jgi:pyruvate/2-oxoglutarate/acetoin dehydrogenase E1 component